MMFFLLLAVASAQYSFTSTSTGCAYANDAVTTSPTLCDYNPQDGTPETPCYMIIDGCVTGELANLGVDATTAAAIASMPLSTDIAQALAMCSMGINAGYLQSASMLSPESHLYQCECDAANAATPGSCNWAYASQIAVASSTCLQDTACVTTWNAVKASTSSDGVTWDAPELSFGLGFPSITANDNADFCKVSLKMMEEENAKAMALGTALFATGPGMDGDAAIAECNDIIMEDIKATVGKLIMQIAIGVGLGCTIFTMIGTCAYFKCKKKD